MGGISRRGAGREVGVSRFDVVVFDGALFFGAKSPIELNIATNSVPHPNSENAGPALEVLAAGQTHTSFEHFKVRFVRVSRGTEYCCVISAFMFKLLLPY